MYSFYYILYISGYHYHYCSSDTILFRVVIVARRGRFSCWIKLFLTTATNSGIVCPAAVSIKSHTTTMLVPLRSQQHYDSLCLSKKHKIHDKCFPIRLLFHGYISGLFLLLELGLNQAWASVSLRLVNLWLVVAMIQRTCFSLLLLWNYLSVHEP